MMHICPKADASKAGIGGYGSYQGHFLFAGYAMSCLFQGARLRAAASFFVAAILGAGLLAGAQQAHAQSGEWVNYRNERFGFTLSYPANVFIPQPPPANGDGQTFLTGDGRAKVVVYATANDEGYSTENYRKTILKDFGGYDQMDYSPQGKSWFVLSGFRGDTIYYQKVMFSCANRLITALSVTFPRNEKRIYEGIIERMEDHFRPGNEGCR
jgi:hypothetical protein